MNNLSTTKEMYAIFDTETLSFVKFGSKIAWVSVGAAKNSYACHSYIFSTSVHKSFDDQTQFKIIRISVDDGFVVAELV